MQKLGCVIILRGDFMKAISIRQPWAWAIIYLGKNIENRNWPTRFRGTVAVHASGTMTRQGYELAQHFILKATEGRGKRLRVAPPEKLPYGAIIGLADIVDCVTESDSPWFVGEHGFVLKNRKRILEPITYRGALGLWNVPPGIERKLRQAT